MKGSTLLGVFVISSFFLFGNCKVSYKGESVVSIQITSSVALQRVEDILASTGDYDIWTHGSTLIKGENHIRVKNTTIPLLSQFNPKIFIQDVQDLIDANEVTNVKDGGFFDDYRSYDEIVAELKAYVDKYPSITKFYPSIAKSVEGRDIPAIAISAVSFDSDTAKRFFFQGGQHAREWIGPATVMYIIDQLLTNYGTDPIVTELLQSVQYFIVPLSNPDGYEYSRSKERLWRKNRKKNSDGTYGVDLNRNWDDHWGGQGSSGTPSSDTYRGPSAFSEPESRLIAAFIESIDENNNVLGAIDFHSYSQLVLRPYGWTSAKCPDEQALRIIGDGVSYEIQQTSGKKYTSQRSIDLYVTTGTASDWYYLSGIWAAYTIELRDTGTYGFLLPANQILPTGKEIWASVLYFSQIVLDTHPE